MNPRISMLCCFVYKNKCCCAGQRRPFWAQAFDATLAPLGAVHIFRCQIQILGLVTNINENGYIRSQEPEPNSVLYISNPGADQICSTIGKVM